VFALLWEDGPGGELAAAPTTRRGARYTITWTFPNGDGGEDLVRQSVWPYAAGGPVTFMAPGQKVLDGTTKGGWYRAGDNLRQDLVALGLPDRQPLTTPTPTPSPSPASPSPAADPSPAVWPWVAAGMGVLLVVAAVTLARRRSAGLRAS
jgi:hypothetical protein